MDVPGIFMGARSDYVALAADEIDHAVLVTDVQGTIVYSNRTFHTMFGYRQGDMDGHRAAELLAAEGFDAGVMQRISEEVLLRYNGMLMSVFELLADSREQVTAVNGYIESLRDFWLAESDLQMALTGRSPGGAPTMRSAAPAAAASGGGH